MKLQDIIVVVSIPHIPADVRWLVLTVTHSTYEWCIDRAWMGVTISGRHLEEAAVQNCLTVLFSLIDLDILAMVAPEEKRRRIEPEKRKHVARSRIFQPFRALGYITNDVPFVVETRGQDFFLTTSVGHNFQTYNVWIYTWLAQRKRELIVMYHRWTRCICSLSVQQRRDVLQPWQHQVVLPMSPMVVLLVDISEASL